MKLDYDFIKQILTIMEENESHQIWVNSLLKNLEIDADNQSMMAKYAGHIKILGDCGYIDCDWQDTEYGIQEYGDGTFDCANVQYRITAQGYEFLDVLKNDTVLNKIKNFALPTAFEVGKQLLVQLLTGPLT